MTTDDYRMAVPLGPDEVYLGGIEVVAYLDANGEQSYRIRFDTGVPVSTLLGCLELAKADVIAMSDWRPNGGDA